MKPRAADPARLKIAWSVIIAFQLFRFFLLPFMGLMPQDAYYFFYGQNLALSYFDHPGMIGYILRLFTEIFGQYPFVIKLADFAVTSCTTGLFYILAGYFLPAEKRRNAILLLSTTCLVSILSVISTPDVPLLFFWTLSLICLYQAVFNEKKIFWIWSGIAMGLAFDSKYTAIMLQAGLTIYLLLSARHRKYLLSGWFWCAMLLSLLTAFPVLIWNYQHSFASFLFQSSARSQSVSFLPKPLAFLGTAGHQAFIILPFLLVALVGIALRYGKKLFITQKFPSAPILFLLCFFLPVFAGFLFISLFYWVKINWMMPAYISGIILAAAFMNMRWIKAHLLLSVIVHVALAAELLFYIVPVKSDDTWYGWEQLAMQVREREKDYPGVFIFSDDNYKTTAELSFYLDKKVYAQNIIGKNALQFDYVNDNLRKLKGRDAFFIDSDTRVKNIGKKGTFPPQLKAYFREIKELEPILIRKNERIVRKFWIYHCENYSPLSKN